MAATLSDGSGTPVVFIHGLWLHPSSWQPWEELFQANGYRAMAPGWPGVADSVEATRGDPDAVGDRGVEEVTAHYAEIISGLPAPPVLIGHSFGGMIAQKLLGTGVGIAAVGIDAAQFKGVLPLPLSSLKATLPVFRNPGNRHKAVSLTPDQFRYAFGNAVEREESDRLYEQWAIPAPGRPLFEAATANFSPHSPVAVDAGSPGRPPLLLVMGGKDHTVPEAISKSEFKHQNGPDVTTDLMEFADRGHSLTIDGGWHQVAAACMTWVGNHIPAMA
ncbi:alpha/beta hydrolase [Actinospica durhamensis]|uniref:Alpha/beta hydrolase n=1 Tax=Actinospica durhamensis TaxID=1508375 RepID=A0A941EQ99_9ACTN|nr:alpha/beta hydrolase [Actinospica durhamensis]MBR7835178.1 alpha/beta hydrolase [Actinospica durhamensis]